jgi:amino acid transporter
MATIEDKAGAPQSSLASGALTLFDTISSTLANLAPVEGIFLAITLVVLAMGSMSPWAFLIAGIAILATGNTMSEFSRSIPSAGSFVTFIGRGVGARAPRTGSVLAGLSYYMLVICYPVTVAAVVVVFMGSWVASLAGWGNVAWLLITLGGVALAVPLLLRGVVISARASFIMFCSEALGLLVLSVVVLIRAGQRVLGLDTRYRADRRGGDRHRLRPAPGRAAARRHGGPGIRGGGRMRPGRSGA